MTVEIIEENTSDVIVLGEESVEIVVFEDGTTELVELVGVTSVDVVQVDATPDAVIEVVEAGPIGPAGPIGGFVEAVAGVTLSGHRAVIPDVDGTLIYADQQDSTQVNLPVYLTFSSWAQGEVATVVGIGPVEEASWDWTPLLPIYLGSNGLLTQVAPTSGFLRKVASVASPTSIWFDPQPAITLT